MTGKAILFLLLVRSVVSAQHDDPRRAMRAPSESVASVEVKTVRYRIGKVEIKERTELQRIFDIHPKKDSLFIDTLKREEIWFSAAGKPDSSFFDFHSVRKDYYTHISDTSWFIISKYAYTRRDSTAVHGDSAVTYVYYDGKLSNRLVYSGAAAYFEYVKKPQKHPNWSYWVSSPSDSFWDYRAAGTYSKRIITNAGSTDTVLYCDAGGNWIVKTTNYKDTSGRCIRTDYYNRGANRFTLVRLRANPHIGDATLYLHRNGETISMQCVRKYNADGLLLEEAWQNPASGEVVMKKIYGYRFR
jgi:hypothetical protein